MKTMTFAVPCYNSAEYMDKCIESILACGDDIEIVIVNDGSFKDNTAEKADEWQERYPDIIKAVHKPNGGHGSAVNMGLEHATGFYYKVVDSDDWLDPESMEEIMSYARSQVQAENPTDLIIGNYVYEKVFEDRRTPIRYKHIFPEGREFGWDEVGHFPPSKYLLMHSVYYRTDLLKGCGLKLPEHTFYVDNIFVYVPLAFVDSMYYVNADAYRYFIGREDQSVNEQTMVKRVEQQLRVTRLMIDAVKMPQDVPHKKLRAYMLSYLSMMMTICSILLRLEGHEDSDARRAEIWEYLKENNPGAYRKVRANVLNLFVNVPTEAGAKFGIGGYRIAQRLFNFN